METKILVVIITGLFLFALIMLIILSWYGKGIPAIKIIITYISDLLMRSSWLTGNTTEWPKWAE